MRSHPAIYLPLLSTLLASVFACDTAPLPTSASRVERPTVSGAFDDSGSGGTTPPGHLTALACVGTPASGTSVPSGSAVFATVTATPNPGAGIEIFFEEFCDGVSLGAAAIDPPGPTDAMGAMRGGGIINCAPGEEFRVEYTMPALQATLAACFWSAM